MAKLVFGENTKFSKKSEGLRDEFICLKLVRMNTVTYNAVVPID